MTSNLELRHHIRRGNVRKARQLRAQQATAVVEEPKEEPEAPQTEIPLDLADTTEPDPDDEGVEEDPAGEEEPQ